MQDWNETMFFDNIAKPILSVEQPGRDRKQRFKYLKESYLARQGFESSTEEEEDISIIVDKNAGK